MLFMYHSQLTVLRDEEGIPVCRRPGRGMMKEEPLCAGGQGGTQEHKNTGTSVCSRT